MDGLVASIQRIADKKGIRKKVVAERAGFTAQQFCDMLHGRKIIRAEYLPAIAEALGVEAGELLGARLNTEDDK